MRKIFILLLLTCSSILMAIPSFQQEVADSLISHLKKHIDINDNYYLITSSDQELNSYFKQNLNSMGIDMRIEQSQASKTIQYSITEDISYVTKRKFLFNRKVAIQKYTAEASLINNDSSKIEHYLTFSAEEESPITDGEISLWKPVLISIITGSLIYSLWSIE